jgi:hypothetical protein
MTLLTAKLLMVAIVLFVARAVPQQGAIMFTTGWDGPIDDGDNWRNWTPDNWQKMSTVVSVGALPDKLVVAAHAKNKTILQSLAYDRQQLLGNSSAAALWAKTKVGPILEGGADGLCVLIRDDVSDPALREGLTTLFAALRANLPAPLKLYATVTLQPEMSPAVDTKALAQHADLLVLTAFSLCEGSTKAAANIPIDSIGAGVTAYLKLGLASKKLAVALPWFGYDFPCSTNQPGGLCSVVVPGMLSAGAPPDTVPVSANQLQHDGGGVAFTWRGWVIRTSSAFAAARSTQQPRRNASAVVHDTASDTLHYDYFDTTHHRRQVWYDDASTLKRKYAAALDVGESSS